MKLVEKRMHLLLHVQIDLHRRYLWHLDCFHLLYQSAYPQRMEVQRA